MTTEPDEDLGVLTPAQLRALVTAEDELASSRDFVAEAIACKLEVAEVSPDKWAAKWVCPAHDVTFAAEGTREEVWQHVLSQIEWRQPHLRHSVLSLDGSTIRTAEGARAAIARMQLILGAVGVATFGAVCAAEPGTHVGVIVLQYHQDDAGRAASVGDALLAVLRGPQGGSGP